MEAVKTVSDLFMPVSGKVLDVNDLLNKEPELLNSDPYNSGWIVKISLSDLSQLDSLMSAEEYESMVL